eukprot:CAMPEP_0183806170 /NCGR_PEP_ID=MMETSP0803_2-20130417/38864_1 /TAXON_ID=195967 /ORGANISM="Crustomastix stigmata, Strain CCMP3273" /LENGTH=167 /DNA_ID=CAMNT_0026050931 /DNA_START=145 /DNA_END=651 /DNA_ORIENTATION=-
MFYGATVWDPVMIIAQIACVQCLFYMSLGVLLWMTVGAYVDRLTLYYVFDYRSLSVHSRVGWLCVLAFLANACVTACVLPVVVERAKKCLDFTATAYVVHTVLCVTYGGWPRTFEWWAVNGTCVIVMAVLGEWLCLRRELREIPLSSLSGGRTTSGGTSSTRGMNRA